MQVRSLQELRTLYAGARERSVKKEMPQLDVHCTRWHIASRERSARPIRRMQ